MSQRGSDSRRVVGGEGGSDLAVRGGRETGILLLGLLGGSFLLVGLVDLALLWYPLNFDQVSWEFATLSQTLSSVPMTGLGLGLVAFATVTHPDARPGWVRTVAVLFVLAAVVFITMGGLYVTVAPEVVRGSAPQSLGSVSKALVKNGVEAVVYTVVFGWVGVRLWRSVRSR